MQILSGGEDTVPTPIAFWGWGDDGMLGSLVEKGGW